ncbi:zinc-dependent metalloprotease [Rudaeicoccus suwonensis]|uniref:Putative hydrolase/coenzyme F420 biosynthesis associated uncharacterized protein n=1 Tax=Rudaeicoccus suwonensis TaxID=657409 RepID=A0A561E2W2_9MICO|nr:zinc-dependent metalloprotease [Rudaeicoccus suwonensis]TWE09955.1 putative hydrolase/coenzyme F420 biosynthesis associated uncharacterized protein [Rudaeicoccus suwonensis]
MSELYVDWTLAKRAARRLVADGPEITATEAADAVENLREAAMTAQGPVAETSRMDASVGPDSPVRVVDRGAWIDLNVDSMADLLGPVVDKITAKKQAGPRARAVGAKITGAETGGLMAFVATKVLGQFDLAPQGQPSLLLIAPNIVAAERELQVSPRDFRLWVCLHEEAHRVQFTAVPWLREHLIERSRQLVVDLVPDPAALQERMQNVVKALPSAVREGGGGLSDLVVTPQQRAEIADLTAVMSLLEGHADVVMDDVGPQVVPTVTEIRARFNERRRGAGSLDRVIRRLLGFEAKMRQYRDGAAFCRAVQEQVGVDGFNAIWSSPQTLPTAAEIEAPHKWVARVHG